MISLSYIAHSRGQHEECLALCESAKEIYESLGAETPSAALAHVYTGISYSLSEMERNEEASEAGRRAIELLEEIGSPEVLNAYRNEGRFFMDAKNYQESLVWYRKALEYVSPDETNNNRGWDSFNVGRALSRTGDLEPSIQYFSTARDIFKSEKNLWAIACCDEELSRVYAELNQVEFAKTHAELALDFSITSENELRTYWANVRYARSCQLGGLYEEAIDFYKAAKSWEVTNGEYLSWANVFALELEIANCHESLGEEETADAIRRRITALSETLDCPPVMP